MDAYNNPSFYRQLGKDPEQLMTAAPDLLAKKFSLKAPCSLERRPHPRIMMR